MSKKKGVSSKTHTKKQLDDYANQHNPNNKAHKSRINNQQQMNKRKAKEKVDYVVDLDWMCYSNGMYEFD